ncbi:MAG: peptidoglycan-binding protein [Anaerolineaceae bacterium]
MNITLEQFSRMIPTNRTADTWYEHAVPMLKKYNIDTRNRIAGFMSQTGHESSDFRVLVENLNYSAQGLRQTFPNYFRTDAQAQQYARRPEAIANFVYDDRNPARRNKIGNVNDGDGWKFRGAGLIQTTGRNNFQRFGASIGMAAEEAADYAKTTKGALESACWYWTINNLNRFADNDDIRGMSVAVNGGTIGLADRTTRYNRNKDILRTVIVGNPPDHQGQTLRRGSKGNLVRQVQAALRLLPVDGDFGPQTEAAVKSWQRLNKLQDTGILDSKQIDQLLKS